MKVRRGGGGGGGGVVNLGAGRFTHMQVVSHPQWCGRFTPNIFSDQLFYCSNIIIIISGKVTKIVYICNIYEISAQKLKYLIYIYVVYTKCI